MPRVAVFLALLAAVLLAVVYGFAWMAPSVGLYHDDGLYLVTAKALAEGKGYQIISLPHGIPQTKYPFLFPAVLAVVWKLFPGFPGNVPLLKAVPLLCAAGWFVLTYVLLRRLQATRVQAAWVVLLTAAAPLVIFFSTNLMSEPMFALLFTAALLAAQRAESDQPRHWAWIAGVLSALAFLTRTLGISLFIGIPLAFAIRHRFGSVWRFLLSGAVLAGGWPLWVRLHAGAADPKQLYYSWANYSSWNILMNYDVPDKLRIFAYNLLFAFAAPAAMFDLPASIWFTPLFAFLAGVLLVKRLVAANAVFLSLAVYLGIVLCWAWPPQRFVAVLLPFILFLTWRAVDALSANKRVRVGITTCAALLSCFVLLKDLNSIPKIVSSGQMPIGGKSIDEWPEMEKVFAWIRSNTAENAVVLANIDPAIYLYTGRKSTRSNVADSYKLFYSADAPADDSAGSLEQILSVTNAGYLVVTPDRLFAEAPVVERAVSRISKTNPAKLTLMDRPGADPEYRIYRVRP